MKKSKINIKKIIKSLTPEQKVWILIHELSENISRISKEMIIRLENLDKDAINKTNREISKKIKKEDFPILDIELYGKFSPIKFKESCQLPIQSLRIYGEICKSGRYKNKKSPYGLGLIPVFNTKEFNSYIDKLNSMIPLKEKGITEITLVFYKWDEKLMKSLDEDEIGQKIRSMDIKTVSDWIR